MEQLIASISILSTIIFAAAFILAIRIPRESMDGPSIIFLAASISIFIFDSFCNMLEYGGITDALDVYGDYTEILFDPLFIFFVYSYLSWQERCKTEKARDELKESEARYRAVVDDQTELISRYHPDGTITFVNKALCQHAGKDYEELIGENFLYMLHDEDRAKVEQALRTLDMKNPSVSVEHAFVNPETGEVFWQRWINRAIFDEKGTIVEFQGVGRDITVQRKAEENLRLQSKILNRMAEGVSLTNVSNGTIIYTNPAYERMFGYGPGELINKHVSVLNAPVDKDPAEIANEIITSLKEHATWSGEVHNIRTDGTTFWSYASIMTFDHYEYGSVWVTVQQDITSRKMAEEALRESESKYRNLVENSLEGIALAKGNQVIAANKAILDMLGYDDYEEFLKIPVIDHAAPESKEFIRERMEKRKKGEPLEPRFEYKVQKKDGEIRDIEISTTEVYIGKEIYIQSTFRDITERRLSEEALRESEEKFRVLTATATDAIMMMDEEGRIAYWNKAAKSMFGYEPREVLGKELHPLLAPSRYHAAYKKGFGRFVKTGEGVAIGNTLEFIAIKKDGAEFPIEISVSALKLKGWHAVGIVRDVTSRKMAESELIANREKLAAMSMELSMTEERERRNIASDLHDHIAQALAMTKVRLGEVSKQASGDSLEKLESIKIEMDRIINNTRSLIFDLSPPVLYELGFKEAVEWLAEQVQKEHGIQVIVMAGTQYAQIGQEIRVILFKAVRELIINVVKHAKATTAEVNISDLEEKIHVQVKDNGVGFDVSKIHDYLKEASFGILNLKERIKYMGGTVDFSSEPGQGTAVIIRVPIIHENRSKGQR
jgi:PAS domain S-box-containing protein